MARDYLQEAKEAYADAKEAVQEQHDRIKDDFRFSNPSAPEQWDDWAKKNRVGRPMHTLDRTNQYIQHVVNKQRERKTSADVLPADSGADVEVAKRIKGIIRHIEYTSKADIAWDTAADHQARGGLGWVRVLPKIVDTDTNEQEILIQRVTDPLSCLLDPNSTEPDGSDAMYGFAETTLTKKAFERMYPKAEKGSWDSDGWFQQDSVRIAEYFKIVEEKSSRLIVGMPDGQELTLSEDEYWKLAEQIGFQPEVRKQFTAMKRTQKWCKMTGVEILEETEYPSQWIGIVPVLGHEIWVDGKRYLCGLVRRLMDGQRLHNYEMSALTEALMVQPKAPFLVSSRAIDGLDAEWGALNSGNPAYLPYNDLDENGQPVNAPIRLSPPNFPAAYANSANLAVQEMESSVGLHKSSLGQQSNAVSGRAKLADKDAGETATFHFQDNLRVAKEHVYRIVVDMLPSVYSGRRQAKILGEDDQQSSIRIDDEGPAVQREGNKVVAINLGVGRYDVRVKVGPSYTTIREEMGVKLQEIGKTNPMLGAALTPILMKMSDMPDADKISRVVMAMLPPPVQEAYNAENTEDMPPAAKATIDQQGQQITQMAQAMEQAAKVIEDLQGQVNDKQNVVKAETQSAIAEIQNAQLDLRNQADKLAADAKRIADQKRIAELELDLKAATMTDDEQESAQLKALTDAVVQSQQATQQAVQQMAEVVGKLQQLTLDSLEDVTEFMSAPRKVLRDSTGKPIGIQIGDQVREIQTDSQNNVVGVEGVESEKETS